MVKLKITLAKSRREAELQALLARVEAATGPDREIDETICQTFGYLIPFQMNPSNWRSGPRGRGYDVTRAGISGSTQDRYVERYTASLDAALALVERVLPGTAWDTARLLHNGRGHAALYAGGDAPVDPVQHYAAEAETPALAILAALLKALIAEAASPTDRQPQIPG